MSDLQLMQSVQSLHYLYEYIPHIILRKLISIPLHLKDLLKQVASICVLHHDAAYLDRYHRLRLLES